MMITDAPSFAPSERLAVLQSLDQVLKDNIIGQDHVLPRVGNVLKRGELGLTNPVRPKASFLFLGPTGVGKTELTKVFSSHLFGEGKLARLDMSEFQLQTSVSLLLGEHATDEGILGRRIKREGAKVLLFDEIEKAHRLVLDLLLQMLDAGRITLATGETLDLTSCYIVATSNIGAMNLMHMADSLPFKTVERVVFEQVDQTLRPELIGRFNEKIVFKKLNYDVQRAICLKVIADEKKRLAQKNLQLDVTEAGIEFLLRQGIHKRLGARPMRDTVERYVQTAIMRDVMTGGQGSGQLDYCADLHALIVR